MSVESLDKWRRKRGNISGSKSQSSPNTKSDKRGQTLTDEEREELADKEKILASVATVLTQARLSPFTTKSEFARKAATEVALCASDGLITTRVDDNRVSNVWIITRDGLEVLEELIDAFD